MENGDSRYTSSKEDEQKQSSPRKSPIPSEPVGKITYVKFLLSNAEAGSVIGKRGSTISDFQTQSGARIQLSRNFELFPGTPDRIIMVSGTIEDVLKGVDLILAKLLDEFYVDNNNGETAPRSRVRLVVPNLCCGGIIGKAGSIIKTFIEHSHAVIKISSPENMYPGLRDRLVTLIGTLEEQMQAIELILEKLSEDTNYLQSINAPFAYPASGYNQMGGAYNGMPGYNGPNYPPNGIPGKFQNNRLPIKEERTSSATIGVADEHIGLVVGRGGRNLTDISQISGARIKISNRGDFMTGTNDRKVTITGSQSAIRVAEAMIAQKVTSASRGDDVGEVA